MSHRAHPSLLFFQCSACCPWSSLDWSTFLVALNCLVYLYTCISTTTTREKIKKGADWWWEGVFITVLESKGRLINSVCNLCLIFKSTMTWLVHYWTVKDNLCLAQFLLEDAYHLAIWHQDDMSGAGSGLKCRVCPSGFVLPPADLFLMFPPSHFNNSVSLLLNPPTLDVAVFNDLSLNDTIRERFFTERYLMILFLLREKT